MVVATLRVGQKYLFRRQTDLHIVQGNLTDERYVQDVILNYVLNRANAVGRETTVLLDDYLNPHRARIVQDTTKKEEKINHLLFRHFSVDFVWFFYFSLVVDLG